MAILYAQVNKEPPPLRDRRPELPAAAEQVVRRQLAKWPEDRYPTADSFVSALAEAARETSVPINQTSVLGVAALADAESEALGLLWPRRQSPSPSTRRTGRRRD